MNTLSVDYSMNTKSEFSPIGIQYWVLILFLLFKPLPLYCGGDLVAAKYFGPFTDIGLRAYV